MRMNSKDQIVNLDRGLGFRVVKTHASRYGHRFGGESPYRGTIPRNAKDPVHLLFRFNLGDPRFPLRIKGLHWLPLFYPFMYDGGPMAYRVLSDSAIEILWMEGWPTVASMRQTLAVPPPSFPPPGYPRSFPEAAVKLVPITYEEQRAVAFRDFLEAHSLSAKLSREDERLLAGCGTQFTQLGGAHELCQPNPVIRCPNKSCSFEGGLWTFATLWNEPVPGVDVWQAQGEPIQIIFQICVYCGTIFTLNQSG